MSIADDIAELGASFFRRGLTFGRTGNISAVDADGTILCTPTGVSLDKLKPEALSRMDVDGGHLDRPTPTKEFFLHRALYRARPGTPSAAAPQARSTCAARTGLA